jgi:hypothetical protein
VWRQAQYTTWTLVCAVCSSGLFEPDAGAAMLWLRATLPVKPTAVRGMRQLYYFIGLRRSRRLHVGP